MIVVCIWKIKTLIKIYVGEGTVKRKSNPFIEGANPSIEI